MTKGSFPAGGGSNPSVKPMAGPRVPGKASSAPKAPPVAAPKGVSQVGMMPRHAARMAAQAKNGGKC